MFSAFIAISRILKLHSRVHNLNSWMTYLLCLVLKTIYSPILFADERQGLISKEH